MVSLNIQACNLKKRQKTSKIQDGCSFGTTSGAFLQFFFSLLKHNLYKSLNANILPSPKNNFLVLNYPFLNLLMKKNDERTLLNFIPCASQLHHELFQNVFTNNKRQFVKTIFKTFFFILLAFIHIFLLRLLIIMLNYFKLKFHNNG